MSERKRKRIKPQGEVIRSNVPKRGYEKIGEPQIEMAVWCPDENAETPPTQVHFIIHWPIQMADFPPMVVRFTSPDTLGFIIEELTMYRRTVWPESEKIKGEE